MFALAFEGLTAPRVRYYFLLHRSIFVRDVALPCVWCVYARSYPYHTVRFYVRSNRLIIRSISRSVLPFRTLFPSLSLPPPFSRNIHRPFLLADWPATVLEFIYLTYSGEFPVSPRSPVLSDSDADCVAARRPTICLVLCFALSPYCFKYFGPTMTILSLSLFLHSPPLSTCL